VVLIILDSPYLLNCYYIDGTLTVDKPETLHYRRIEMRIYTYEQGRISHMEYTETDPRPADVEVLKDTDDYTRQELWTNGEWIRLGHDVLGSCFPEQGYGYFEVKVEDFREFINTLRAQSGVEKRTVTDSCGTDVELLIDAGYSLDIYRNRHHILHHNEHEYSVLYTALERAVEERETLEYESLVRSYAESLLPVLGRVASVDEKSNHKFEVQIAVGTPHVDFDLIETLEDSPHVSFTELVGGGITYNTREDEMTYLFRIDGESLDDPPV
jgi:hypothetical protein